MNFVKMLTAGALAISLGACQAEPEASNAGEVDHAAHASDDDYNEAQQAYADVNARMHAGMSNIPADADHAFMLGMLEHHRGAVEMSEVALTHGKDAQVRDLAQRIIDAQQGEIEEMERWLAGKGYDVPSAGEAAQNGEDHDHTGHDH